MECNENLLCVVCVDLRGAEEEGDPVVHGDGGPLHASQRFGRLRHAPRSGKLSLVALTLQIARCILTLSVCLRRNYEAWPLWHLNS
jgi:hypothetical protein